MWEWTKYEYDSNGYKLKQESSNGHIIQLETEFYHNGQLKIFI